LGVVVVPAVVLRLGTPIKEWIFLTAISADAVFIVRDLLRALTAAGLLESFITLGKMLSRNLIDFRSNVSDFPS
jgi:hypothetical protein